MNTIQTLNTEAFTNKFIYFITKNTNEFEGKPGFSDKVKETIRSACNLQVGRTLLQEIMENGKSITILEGKECHFDIENMCISLNFEKEFFYTTIIPKQLQ